MLSVTGRIVREVLIVIEEPRFDARCYPSNQ